MTGPPVGAVQRQRKTPARIAASRGDDAAIDWVNPTSSGEPLLAFGMAESNFIRCTFTQSRLNSQTIACW